MAIIRLPLSYLSKRPFHAFFSTTALLSVTYTYLFSKRSNSTMTDVQGSTPNIQSSCPVSGATATSVVTLNQAGTPEHTKSSYQKVYNTIAEYIRDDYAYDNYIGWGPVLVRYAWHSSGTYTAPSPGCPFSGGSYGGTIRLSKELADGANNGLQNAEWFLLRVKKKYPWISWGDLSTLAGVVAIQELGGPRVGWRSGRVDATGEASAMTDKLPDASKGANYIRKLFARMGLTDREVVSLMGAHALGSCHITAPKCPGQRTPVPGSGYFGKWTYQPNRFTNEFYQQLLQNGKWHKVRMNGPEQYISYDGLMMLPADMALIQDSKYKKIVLMYARDQDLFFKDFAQDFQKLLELGIDYPEGTKSWFFNKL